MSVEVKDGPRGLKALHFGGRQAIYFRDGTSDAAIVQSVFLEQKEYVFPPMRPKLVIDAGANIGVVSVILANLYPDAEIHAFEPVPQNFEILLMNTESYPNVKRHQLALGRETRREPIFPAAELNHGGFSLKRGGEPVTVVDVVAIRAVIDKLGQPLDLLKIDTEGAEWEIISGLASDQLHSLKWISGELHGVNDWELFRLLDDAGFKLSIQKPLNETNYHFHASRLHD